MNMLVFHQKFGVEFEFDVIFADGVWRTDCPIVADLLLRGEDPHPIRTVVFVDEGVARARPSLLREIERYFGERKNSLRLLFPPYVLPGGERVKNDLRFVQQMLEMFDRAGLCRHSFVIAVGGGAVLDAVGFATALYHRGLRLIRMPTTVLAQNDVGVGVKNAINYPRGKNTVGTFAVPWAVVNDFSFLDTLSDADWIAGAAEAFKVALIKDRPFFEFLCGAASRLRRREAAVMRDLIVRCAKLHLDHIRESGDPFEFGHARPLDFGHWLAHALEVRSGYSINHGKAVAVGIVLDSLYAVKQGWLGQADFEALFRALRECGFELWYPCLGDRDGNGQYSILEGIERFRQHLGGRLFITFPNGVGRRKEVSEIDYKLMAQCLDELREMEVLDVRAT